VIDPSVPRPRTVVGFLLDGANPNVLYTMADAGEAPNVARLMAMGTTFEHGAVASLPTVTLANHTAILTGAHPGHHEILHNAWFDRASGQQVVTNSPATWAGAMRWLGREVDTIHSAVRRTWPDELSVSINEPCDALAPGRDDRATTATRRAPARHAAVRAPDEGLPVVVAHRPHERRAGGRHLERALPGRRHAAPAVHVGELHAHRRRLP
jgi:hypothetical protein